MEDQVSNDQPRQPGDKALRSLVERVPAIFYTAELGEHGRWRFVSPQIEQILGFTPEEWMADPTLWARQLHPEDREHAISFEDERYLETASAPPAEYRMLTRDGRVVWILEEAKLELDADGVPVWHGVMYDITERKRIEHDFERLADQQAVIAGLGERALQGQDPRVLMAAAVEALAQGEDVQHACIWKRDLDGEYRLHAASFPFDRRTAPPAGGASHVAHVIDSHMPVTVNDWGAEGRFDLPAALTELDPSATVAAPIETSSAQVGVLEVHSTEAGRFAVQDVHFLQAVANVLATALERRNAEEVLRHRAAHDPLTGLPNRELFVEDLEQRLARAAKTGAAVAVLFLDVDNFKLINDGLGHHAGDELLRKLADRLSSRLRAGDVVARFGGDEFAIVLDNVGGAAEAAEVAQRLGNEVARPISAGGVENFVTVSIGVALARPAVDDGVTPESLIRDADAAMYGAKARGRDTYELYDVGMSGTAARQMEIQRGLRFAAARGELELVYQPTLAMRAGRVDGFEALVRWRHPTWGLLSPAEFIPVAEQTGVIDSVGRWVLETAAREAAAWPNEQHSVSVNVAARQITHGDLHATVLDVLARTGLDPARLELEITEGVLLERSEPVADTLNRLAASGVRVFLDDFGTGYSALAYLDRFRLAGLKIDRSFVERLDGGDERSVAIVEAIIAMARALGLEVVAEGVSTHAQLEILRALGCDRVQGFLLSQPVPATQIASAADELSLA
ncbi:MAG TPA: EAL domain-containing protein [Solirubrobacterales bacterium]|jgi:diguanylate cyclase (GGDEF)-like protein/PAS domain S-box-containing protein